MGAIRSVAWFALLTVALLGAAPARAADTGQNGRIAFESGVPSEIYTMNPDGSGVTALTSNALNDVNPRWSPDGLKIAFRRDQGGAGSDRDQWVMNADGSDQHLVATYAGPGFDWAPDSQSLVVNRTVQGNSKVVIVNAQGTSASEIADGIGPLWSVDGMRIAFAVRPAGVEQEPWRVDLISPAGTDRHIVFSAATNDYPIIRTEAWAPDSIHLLIDSYDGLPGNAPELLRIDVTGTEPAVLVDQEDGAGADWSPDGSRIAAWLFSNCSVEGCQGDVFTMDPDGTNRVRLTSQSECCLHGVPRWAPDGTRIVFSDSQGIATVDPDGSNIVRLGAGASPDWQRAPALPPSTPDCSTHDRGSIVTAPGTRPRFTGRAQTSSTGETSGYETYTDSAEGLVMRSTSIEALVCAERDASVFGRALVNGGELAFQIDLHDGGPRSRDTYRLRLSNGYDSGQSSLRSGQVTVR